MKQLVCVRMEMNFFKHDQTKTELIMFTSPKGMGNIKEWTVNVSKAIIHKSHLSHSETLGMMTGSINWIRTGQNDI